jgi:uncharacterized protein YuzE
MLRLIVDPKTDRGYIDFAPMNECPGGDVAHRKPIVVTGDMGEVTAIVSLDYDRGQRIAGIEILNPSSLLGHRFRTDGDQAVFPIYLSVDYTADKARITLRERSVGVEFEKDRPSAVITIKELPGDTVRSVEAGPVAFHYSSKGKISAISMSCASITLPERFRRLGSEGK